MKLIQLSTVFGALFLVGSAEVVAGPMMTFMGPDFGVASNAIAYLPAAYGLAYGAIALIAGPLSDRLGRKRPLQAGLLGFSALCALMPKASCLWMGVALAGLTGVCAAIIQPNCLALVGDRASSEKIDRYLGRVFVGLMLAFVLTPSIAGWLAGHTSWKHAYYLLAALAALAFFVVSIVFDSSFARPTTKTPSLASTHLGALSTGGVLARLLASYFWLGWMAGFGAIVADIAASKSSLAPDDAGLLAGFFGLVVIAGNLAGPYLRRAVDDIALPSAAFAGSIGVIAFSIPTSSVYQLALAGMPWAFGYGCGGPLHHARLSGLSAIYRGTINSYHASLLNLGIFSVSFLFGSLVPVTSLTFFCLAVGVVSLIGAVLLALVSRP
ncbi:MFS transporter [Methylocystis bryophila]|uniref:MFS transporter n=1 Tax=Methylocystis bryophila TaxID=655015 RepID=A0A1W6N0J0_9HYPH|nr:MFS transporter [Methylocystis bryophila]ARN83357.1 MFS transporter [Methylocystis bryophila]BDV40384.1 multidrug resistance protein [Methylocystis bryophila]